MGITGSQMLWILNTSLTILYDFQCYQNELVQLEHKLFWPQRLASAYQLLNSVQCMSETKTAADRQ